MLHETIKLNESGNIYLKTYIIDDPLGLDRKRPTVVICPGGAYSFCSAREAEPIASSFNAAGFNAVVVYYSLETLFPASLKDASDAVTMVRQNSEKWHVDTDKVIVCGFSAGGHLAASLGVFWNSEPEVMREDKLNRPNGLILSYPVITSGEYTHTGSMENITKGDKELMEKVSLEKHVTSDCPPAFIWHTFTDECVPVENSLLMASAMAKAKVPCELHIFPRGSHGLSLSEEWTAGCDQEPVEEPRDWMRMAIRWIRSL